MSFYFLPLGKKNKQKPVSRGTAPVKFIIMIESDIYCKYWHTVVGVTIPFKGSRGVGQKLSYFIFDSWVRKLNKKPVSRGTAPVKLIIMIESETYCNYWYIVVGVTIPFDWPQRGQSKIVSYFIFDS